MSAVAHTVPVQVNVLHVAATSDVGLPSVDRIWRVLAAVGEQLGARRCFALAGSYYFPLGGRWHIAVAPQSAHRFRISACRGVRPAASLWSTESDDDRLAGVVAELVRLISARQALDLGGDALDDDLPAHAGPYT